MAIVVLGFFVCSCPASIIGADDANSATDKKGWSSILAATDPSQTSAVPSPAQLAYQTNQMGAFLHYGPAVFLDGDWKSVPDPKVFNPTQLDAEQWVRTTKSFDAKHLIFSSKHHNGFCLWPTKTTSYSVCSSPWKNGQGDVVREVAEACKKYGIKLGFYYSQAQDWNNGGSASGGKWDKAQERDMDEYIDKVAAPQVREILTQYGQFPAVLWWDTPCGMTKEYADQLIPLLKLRPGIIHNNRLGIYPGDTETPEQEIPHPKPGAAGERLLFPDPGASQDSQPRKGMFQQIEDALRIAAADGQRSEELMAQEFFLL